MIVTPWAAALVVACAGIALAVINISNVMWGSKKRQGIERRAEVSPPSSHPGLTIMFVGVATFSLFILSGLYVILALLGLEKSYPLGLLQIPQPESVRASGVVLFVAGTALFAWSVLSRGRYSVSWAMPIDQKLVTWGPYRYIRHPSYTGYFLMFVGLFLTWFNLLAAIPLLGIPGYSKISRREEEMLALRFGDSYVEYRKRTGSFLPNLRRRRYIELRP